MKIKISFDCQLLEIIIPGAYMLDFLPRKRKKKLKKFVANRIIEIANDEVLRMEAMLNIEVHNKLME